MELKSDYKPMSVWEMDEELRAERTKRKQSLSTAVTIIVCIIIAAGIAIGKLITENNGLQTQVEKLETTIALRDATVDKLYKEIETTKLNYTNKIVEAARLTGKLNALQEKYDFYYDNAVLVTARAGAKYHHYGCHYVAGRDYYIYNIELARSWGYTPCSYCFG